MNNSIPFKRFFFIFVGAGLLLIHSWFSYISFHFPYVGIGVTATNSGTWVISDIYKDSAAEKLGLALNDTVALIDKRPTGQHFTVSKYHDIEQAHSIEIIRDRVHHSFDIKNSANEISARYIIGIIGELVLFAISVVVYFKVKHSRSVYYLLAVLILMGLAFIGAEASARSDSLAKFIVLNAMSFIPFLFAQFVYHFLKEKGYKLFSYRWFKYGFILLSILAVMRLSYFFSAPLHSYFVLDRFISLLCFALGCLFAISLLFVIYRKKRHEYSFSAGIIRVVFTAFGISFLPFLLLSVLPDLFGKPILDYASSVWFIILFPATCIYYAGKNKLKQTPRFGWPLHPKQRDAFYRLLEEQGQVKQLEDASHHLLPNLCQALNLTGAAIRLQNNNQVKLAVHGKIDADEIEQLMQREERNSATHVVYGIYPGEEFSSHIILAKKEHGQAFHAEQQRWISAIITQLSIMIENIYLSDLLSLKINELLTEPAAAGDKSPHSYLWFRKSLYEMQEKERQRVASDLHDTIMQDIYFAKQRVAAIRDNASQSSHLEDELKELMEYLDIINLNVRETGFQLYPHLLKEVGFAVTVSNLIESERMKVPFQLHLRIEHKAEWDALDTEVHHHLFRIMQELLSNAKKHAMANQIDFHLHLSRQGFIMEYQDDGIGFDDQLQSTGIGWHGIKHRMNSLEGQLHYDTAPNEGLKLVLTLPTEGTDPVEHRN
ncbi:sensor histidine kinase [Paenibacillus paridis]|uniref:sensor histidine kinase n=1 Tax=Paenibacillus paridis TaxID=2583376 RepID=UPI0013907EA7|nr:ATP-binding protein [Paenibacillus paridis]